MDGEKAWSSINHSTLSVETQIQYVVVEDMHSFTLHDGGR